MSAKGSGYWQPFGGPREPRRVGDTLQSLTKKLGMATPNALGAVFGRWPEIVGDAVAANSRPAALKDTTLVVEVDQPGWATQLRFLEADLLQRLAEVAGAGAVTRIDVRVRRR